MHSANHSELRPLLGKGPQKKIHDGFKKSHDETLKTPPNKTVNLFSVFLSLSLSLTSLTKLWPLFSTLRNW